MPTDPCATAPSDEQDRITATAATGDPWSVCEKCGVRWRIDHKCMIERMADEAEHGYDPEQLSPVPCVNCGDPIEFIPYDTGNGGEWRHVGATVSAAYCLAKRENAPVTLASPRDNG